MMTGAELIAQERRRQIEEEDYTPEHDDAHEEGEIALAAACYALPAEYRDPSALNGAPDDDPAFWPWIYGWSPTPGDRIRELVKAGALICAEIDRLQRMEDNR
jgi:hypothetical protein